MDDCLTDDDEALRQYLRHGPSAVMRPRKDRRGGYRRDVTGVVKVLTADPPPAAEPVSEDAD